MLVFVDRFGCVHVYTLSTFSRCAMRCSLCRKMSVDQINRKLFDRYNPCFRFHNAIHSICRFSSFIPSFFSFFTRFLHHTHSRQVRAHFGFFRCVLAKGIYKFQQVRKTCKLKAAWSCQRMKLSRILYIKGRVFWFSIFCFQRNLSFFSRKKHFRFGFFSRSLNFLFIYRAMDGKSFDYSFEFSFILSS